MRHSYRCTRSSPASTSSSWPRPPPAASSSGPEVVGPAAAALAGLLVSPTEVAKRAASRRLLRRRLRLLHPRQHFLGDERDLVDRLLVGHVPGVRAHEEVAQAADVLAEFRELLDDVVGG